MISFKSTQLRLSCWLAVLAMLTLVLLPTITHALTARADSSIWADLCSVSGATGAVHESDGSAPQAPGGTSHPDHCAACRIAVDAMALAPAAVPAMVLPLGGVEPPAAFLQAPPSKYVWRRAQTRAPPLLT
ncbi:MAG: DUF2946 domain-containing protein [Burkholderiales bacterium]|nr:DUF2946 domain-containing protein [Burkholderiales bacterium]